MSESQGIDFDEFRLSVSATKPRRENDVRVKQHRLLDIDRAKGFAIILVVLGHIVARQPPLGNEWYTKLQVAIYVFHMPFFMYLAGVVFAYGENFEKPQADFRRYLFKRANRLLTPFVVMGLVILVVKLFASRFLFIDKIPDGFIDGLTALVWNTDQSPAIAIWFIFVLFCYCAITPLLLRLSNGLIWPLLVFAAGLHFLHSPALAYGDRMTFFYVFFVVGMLVGRYFPAATSLIDRTYPLFCGLFVAGLAIILTRPSAETAVVIASLAALPALHGLIRSYPLNRSATLLQLGKLAFAIYLFNTLFIGAAKGLLLAFIPSWDGEIFLLFFPLLMTAGLVGPIALKYFALDRVPALRHFTE
jgi:fucose 4-O-acetylase-like acetyltransferase